MRDYLEGYRFTVITDHQSLKWLRNLESPSGRLGRWLFELQQYDFSIQYRRGALNKVADALSRQPAACANRSVRCTWYQRLSQNVRRNPNAFPDYMFHEGRLFRHLRHDLEFHEQTEHEQWKQCVPREERDDLMERLHGEPTSGHFGIAKTIARMARRYYWPGMFRDVARFVRQCKNCLAHKPLQRKPAGHAHAHNVTEPWRQVTTDLIGPLPRSVNGHTWLLVTQDRFTKWVKLTPLHRATGDTVTAALVKETIHRHGCPDLIISDNGKQFRSRSFTDMLKAHGITHRTTPIYTPQCNPVERTNKTIKTMIAQYVGKNHRRWDQQLTAIRYAYNSIPHDATGFSPAYLNYGREIAPPNPADRSINGAALPQAIWKKRMDEAFELVRINLARAFQRQAPHYNLRRRHWIPAVGEKVWKREHVFSNKASGVNAKLAPKYSGPFTVGRVVTPVIVDLRDQRGKWIRHIYVKDLKLDGGKTGPS
jgi:transposase InsO family protein